MTNPADVLTDEFIERVIRNAGSRALLLAPARTARDEAREIGEAVLNNVRAVLREEREPIHRLVFEVRAPNRQSALNRLNQAISDSEVGARSDIRLVIEQDAP